MRGLIALVLVVSALLIVGVSAFIIAPRLDPVEQAKRAQLAAVEVAAAEAQAAWWNDFRAAAAPWLLLATAAAAVTLALGLPALAGLMLWQSWDARRKADELLYPRDGMLPLPRDRVLTGEYAQLTAAGVVGHWQAKIERAKLPQFSGNARTENYAPRFVDGRAAPVPLNAPPSDQVETPPALPGPLELGQVLNGKPSLDRVLIAIGPGGQPLFVGARELCHVALAGATGGGKSNLMRLLLAQLLAAGARVVLADPHYAPIDPDDPLTGDWRPIERRLDLAPAVTPAEIGSLLDLIDQELSDRLERRRAGERIGAPLFLALDELPSIVNQVNGAPDVLTRVVREGRKVGVLAISSAQDFLVKSLGGSSAARDNFRTAYYVGGDAHTARVLLDVRGRVDDGQLGKGLVMLRSAATPQAQLARVPLVTDQTLHRLLPSPVDQVSAPAPRVYHAEPPPPARPSLVVLPGGGGTELQQQTTTTQQQTATTPTTTTTTTDPDEDRRRRIRELAAEGMSKSSIAHVIWGYKDVRTMRLVAEALNDQDQAADAG